MRQQGNPLYRRHKYYATSRDMEIQEETIGEYSVEYNPNVGMYRITHSSGSVPLVVMGYHKSKSLLMDTVKRITRRENG